MISSCLMRYKTPDLISLAPYICLHRNVSQYLFTFVYTCCCVIQKTNICVVLHKLRKVKNGNINTDLNYECAINSEQWSLQTILFWLIDLVWFKVIVKPYTLLHCIYSNKFLFFNCQSNQISQKHHTPSQTSKEKVCMYINSSTYFNIGIFCP